MTKNNILKKNHFIHVGLTIAEFSKIDNMYKISTCRSKAEYVRELISNRPITIFNRNQSLDNLIEEIVILNNAINTLKIDLSKILETKHLNTNGSQFEKLIQGTEVKMGNLYTKMDEVKTKIERIVEKWLQS